MVVKPLHLYAAGAAVALVAVVLLLRKGNAQALGSAVGGAAVGAVVGVASGAVNTAVDAAENPEVNPLYDFGSWLGGAVYDMTHLGG